MRRHFAESLGPMLIVASPIVHDPEPRAGETTAMEWMGFSDGRASDLPLNFTVVRAHQDALLHPDQPDWDTCVEACDAAHIVSPAKEDLKSGSQRTYTKFD